MKYKFFVVLYFAVQISYSCSCTHLSLIDRIISHDYIAKVKIVESVTIYKYTDTFNPYYVKIETSKQYYGAKVNEIYLESKYDSSCGMDLPVGTEWIIFGNINNDDGTIQTSLCSGNFKLNITFDSIKNETYYLNNQTSILNILNDINIKKIKKSNQKVLNAKYSLDFGAS